MNTQIMPVTPSSLRAARELVGRGELVAFHTETVYGLGADAFSDEAVQKIFALKGRPANNPLIVHVHRGYDIGGLVDGAPAYTEKLRKAFLPGPLTMVYPSTGKVSRFVSCGLDTLAIRVPSSEAAQAFLREVNIPIAAPSANRSKHVSPVTAEHVYDDFNGELALILDGGACSGGIESTVLDCTGKIPVILRAGLVTREMIASVAGDCGVYVPQTGEQPKSPGMAYRHYTPRCRTAYFLKEDLELALRAYQAEEAGGGTPCILAEEGIVPAGFRGLSLGKSGEDMANRLYALLRLAERQSTLLIAIEPTLSGGVMDGVMNRLTRAFGRVGNET